MANTTWSSVGLNDTKIAQNMLRGFVTQLAPLSIFSNDFSNEIGNKGEVVTVPLDTSSVGSVQTKTIGGNYTIGDAALGSVNITLGSPKYLAWQLDDVEVSKSSTLNVDTFGVRKGASLAKNVFQSVLANVTAANYGSAVYTGATSSFDEDDIAVIKQTCDEADWSPEGRYLFINPAGAKNLLITSTFKNAASYGYAAIQTGVIPSVYGFNVIVSNAIPTNSENLFGFVCTGDALAVAMRYLQPQDTSNLQLAEPITYFNPDGTSTGITMGYRKWYNPNSGSLVGVIEALFGSAVGNSAALKRLVTA